MKYKHLSETLVFKKISETDKEGIFYIEGLYTGYGLTLGNALRRVLLSSLPGAAITKIKIKGVSHEFSTIEGMKEDVVEFILNLKKVRFKFNADEPQILSLKVKGENEIKAGDIHSTPLAEVINKDLYLATLTSKNTELEAELTVEKGLGYSSIESRKNEKLVIGDIMIDAVFSPIEKVNFEVENMRVGEKTDYNRLKLEIKTDGSILPSEALKKACYVLCDHFLKISENLENEQETKNKKK